MSDNLKHGTDAAAAGLTALAATMEWMPEVAALCAVIWYLIRFYEYTAEKIRARKVKTNETENT